MEDRYELVERQRCGQEEMKFANIKFPVPVALSLVGGLSFLGAIYSPRAGKLLLVLGGFTWMSAYCHVIFGNLRKRDPIWTRGGPLRYEESPRMFKAVHGFLLFLGLFSFFVFTIIVLFR